ncbi:helix-turn-helix domain-containing protein [Rathayibacter sp. AY1B8]|uniref:helix-turn-helix domain-containing protein n=1 Tax=Rathayibacter sp. AY1B8 TaxID=2080533 RepID=UPI0015E3224C|nr:helix-turn-helix domain-containing protein [Rathayibacter sp. AY1B8]
MSATLQDVRHRAAISVEEAGEVIGIGRASAYATVRNGELPSIRISRRLVVPVPPCSRCSARARPARTESGCEARRRGERFRRYPVKHHEMRVLLWMAHTARDTDTPPRYFGSRETTALAPGYMLPDQPNPTDPEAAVKNAERERGFQRVKVAVSGLVKLGAIARLHSGRDGRSAEFEITLGTMPKPARG